MLKIGLTGGIGSGKSLIGRVFSILGVPVYNADAEAKKIMTQDAGLRRKLRDAFGPGVIGEKGLDRKALAGIIFNDPGALELVNSLVHPAVAADFRSWLDKHGNYPYVINEAAIMFETGMYRKLDTVILVTAPEEMRLQRVMARDGTGEEDVRQRMANQWPDKKKIPLAGHVLKNDNSNPLLPEILELHNEFGRGNIPEERVEN